MPTTKKNILLIAPHPDDIAYSSLLPALGNDGISTVLTVFGRSRYAFGSSNAYDEEMVSSIRKSEDLEFCRFINADLRYLDYPDSSISFSEVKRYIELYPYHSELADIIKSIISDNLISHVYFPMALGWHYDHKIIRDIIFKEIIRDCADTVEFVMYEDMPYTSRFSDKEIKCALNRIVSDNGYSGLSSRTMKSSDVAVQKKVIDIYKSQYDADIINLIIAHKIVDGNIVENFHEINICIR